MSLAGAEGRTQPVVLITGANRGIGLGLSCVLATQGVALVLTGRRAAALDRVCARLSENGCPAKAWACDVTDEVAMKGAFELAASTGELAGVVNNAGVLEPVGPVESIEVAGFEQHVRTNLVGALMGTRLALQHRKAGQELRIVNISSGAATHAYRGWAAYCSSKAAVNALTEVAALEAHDGSTSVVAVAPGIIETRMQQTLRAASADQFPDVARFVELRDKGMLLHPVDAAVALAWLVLAAPLELSGRFVDARSDEVQASVKAWRRTGMSATAVDEALRWFGDLEAAS